MGNLWSVPAIEGPIVGPEQDVEKQSVLVKGTGDWGSGVHRSPEAVDKLIGAVDPYVTTLYTNFQHAVIKFADRPCLGARQKTKDGLGEYEFITFSAAAHWLTEVGSALVHFGIEPKTNVGVYAKNCIEWVIVEHACYAYNIVTVAIYDSLGANAAAYILGHSELPVVFVEPEKLDSLYNALSADITTLKLVVCFAPVSESSVALYAAKGIKLLSMAELCEIGRENIAEHRPPQSTDLALIMYTSGTTGDPKGVPHTHGHMVATINAARKNVHLTPDDCYISYLPLAHCLERICQAYVLHRGVRVGFYSGDIRKFNSDLKALKPSMMIGVPRIFSRIYETALRTLATKPLMVQWMYKKAYAYKLAAIKRGEEAPWCDYLIFDKIRAAVSPNLSFILCGSAPLDADVQEWLRVCLSRQVLQGYGLTETCAGSAMQLPHDQNIDCVGGPLGCAEFKLVSVPELDYYVTDNPPKGELLIKGTQLFTEYYKDEERTAEAFTPDGWFCTGDIGQWNPNGSLSIIDRKKNIFKLAQGEYIASEQLEMVYGAAPHVAQIYVHGDSRKAYLIAVVVPDPSIEDWAKAQNIKGDFATLCESKEVAELLQGELNEQAKQAKLCGYEFIKGVIVSSELFSPENQLLTPTFKIKRPVITMTYKEKIEKIFQEIDARGRL